MSKATWLTKASMGASLLFICGIILASCGTSAGSNAMAVGNARTYQGIDVGTNIKVAMVPKLLGLAVFQANKQGATQVAGPLNINFNYTAPVDASAQGQVQIFNSLIAQHYNVITTTANNPSELAPALERARQMGMKVVSYDSDVLPQARDFFVQNTSYDATGKALVDSLVKSIGPKADIAVLSSSPTATIQVDWLNAVNKYIKSNYPNLHIVTTQYGNSSPTQSLTTAENILHAYPTVKGIIAPDGAAEPAAAEAVDKLGLQGKVFVTGCSDPASIKQYVLNGTIPYSPLWDEVREGQVVMYVARLAANNAMPKNGSVKLGNLGTWQVNDGVLIFSQPLIFTKDNINQYAW
ncbi:MAG TPA: substrate-binding domain-containing protein [Ktedonobacteraceae bacterium]|nr:substrate-binding domain-containing protein [Ktedonobacteraceae bacterium]